MSTEYTHFSRLSFDTLFARGTDNNEIVVINSSGQFVGSIATTAALTISSLTVSNLSTGIAHASSSGVITSSLLVNADVSASAAIDGSKIVAATAALSGVVTATTQTFAGNKTFGGNILPEATGTRNLGSTSLHWNQIWGDSLRMGGSQIGSTNERVSAQNSVTAASGSDNRLAFFLTTTTGNTAVTSGNNTVINTYSARTISADTTDTSAFYMGLYQSSVFTTSANTYTNSNTADGVSDIAIAAITNSGGGTLAISRYSKLYFRSDTVATGTRKSFINFGSLSGSTNNAFISDNNSWTGSYFLNISSTNPSALNGGATFGSNTHNSVTGLRLTGQTMTGASQFGIYSDPSFTSAALTEGRAIFSQVQTAASAFTMPVGSAFHASTAGLGAGSSITRLINFSGVNQTAGTNNAFIADNTSFTGNYFINSTSVNPSGISGNMSIAAGSYGPTEANLYLGGNVALATATQYGLVARPLGSTAGTTAFYGIDSGITTPNSSYTVSTAAALRAAAAAKGAASTITRLMGLYVDVPSAGTNNASISDNDSFSGSYFIHSNSTNESLFSGVVAFAAGLRTKVSTANTANPPTSAELVSAFGAAATVGTGFVGLLNDAGGGTNEYIVWSDGTNYFYATGTKAV